MKMLSMAHSTVKCEDCGKLFCKDCASGRTRDAPCCKRAVFRIGVLSEEQKEQFKAYSCYNEPSSTVDNTKSSPSISGL